MSDDIIIDLEKWLNERGYVLIDNGYYRRDGHEVRFRRPLKEALPPLGIHIRDGVGTGDKVGG